VASVVLVSRLEHACECATLLVLVCCMLINLVPTLITSPQGRMAQLADLTQHHRQQLHQVSQSRRVGPAFVPPPLTAGMSPAAPTGAAAAAAAGAAWVRAKRPPGELAAAIHALVGEQVYC
jgi:hypothetical protein